MSREAAESHSQFHPNCKQIVFIHFMFTPVEQNTKHRVIIDISMNSNVSLTAAGIYHCWFVFFFL